ncbi:MAG: hypothetical protein FJ288_11005 [Planctomycetes bacterium]|nr:hypothetical protein [Planctomycetota bacterium]
MKTLRLLAMLLIAALPFLPLAMASFAAAPATKAAAPPRAAPAAEAPAAAAPAADAAAELVRTADEVAKDVEAIRGWKFKQPVKKKLVTPQEGLAWLRAEIEKQAPADLLARKQLFLRTVGLLPADCDLKKTLLGLLESQLAGYYDTDTKTLCIVRRDNVKPFGLVERIMLAHELGHALDDQHADLKKFLETHGGHTEDGDLAASSVSEGSATALMMRYMMRLQLSGRLDIAELLQFNQEEEAKNRAFFEAPRYFTSLLGAYMCGMNFLAKGNFATLLLGDRDVGQEFLAAVKDPPRSTEQILHPEKYWDAAARDEPVLVSDDDMRKLLASAGRFVVHADTVGEMLCAILTTPKDAKADPLAMAMSAYWTNPAAAGWGGDRFFLLAAGSSAEEAGKSLRDPRAAWLTFWDTEKDRDEFLAACEQAPAPGRAAVKVGSLGAAFFYGFADAERQAVTAKLEKSPPRMTRAAKPWSPWAM